MKYTYKEVEVRQFKRINRITGNEDYVTVSNRNDLSVEEQLRLMNQNDINYRYENVNQV